MDRKKPFSLLLARWRGFIQACAALLANLHLPNFFKGKLYRGAGKTVCVPGLNCYSCPGAAGACPIGAFQAVVGSSKFSFSYYITGFFILLGVLLGRFICGFLCPFGWFQELLHKIPTKKLPTRRLKPLTYLKYVIFIVMVLLLPVLVVNEAGLGDPFFCKYLCPQGVLEGAIPLSLTNASIRAALGKLFSWKLCVLAAVVVLSVVFYRPFCKWLCPLGAVYALFNRVSLLSMQVDHNKCISCGKCARVCGMDVNVCQSPNSTECIRCGKCVSACPTQAVHFRYGFDRGGVCSKLPQTPLLMREKENETMKLKKFLTLALAFTLVLSLAACGSKDDHKTDGDTDSMTAEELDAKIQELANQENAIIEENVDLFQKLSAAMDEKRDELAQQSNYGDYLLAGIELVKDQFTDDEVKTLTESAEKIRDLENEIQPLQEQYAALQPANDGSTDADAQSFPAFTGKDLDGNDVDSSLFSNNAVTVVNFWFSGCAPCVTELGELNALNETLKEQGGAVIGINTDTLDGDADQIGEARSILEKKDAAYQNIYFDSDSEAGQFASGIMAFPTTYVVDRKGNIVGEALLGGIDNEENMAALQTTIDQVLAADSGK